MAKTIGSRNFSDLLEAIQILARKPMNQVSSSFRSFDDEWAGDAGVINYDDMDAHNDADDDGCYDEYDESGEYEVTGSTCQASPRTGRSRSRNWRTCWRTSRMAKKSGQRCRKGKKGSGKGEFRDKKGGKGSRPQNNKQIRPKLQRDRLNRGCRDQPDRETSKCRGRPQQPHVDDLARTRFFKSGELGRLAKDCPQNKEDVASLFSGDKDLVVGSETFFSVMVCDDLSAEADFGEDDASSKGKREGVPFRPQEPQHQDLKQESNSEVEHEPSRNTPDVKRQMEIDIANGASVRAAFKAMRKRLRTEARRQEELQERVA